MSFTALAPCGFHLASGHEDCVYAILICAAQFLKSLKTGVLTEMSCSAASIGVIITCTVVRFDSAVFLFFASNIFRLDGGELVCFYFALSFNWRRQCLLCATPFSTGIFVDILLASCGISAVELPALLSVLRWQAFVRGAQVNCGSFCGGEEAAG